jgi:hypothetical protein
MECDWIVIRIETGVHALEMTIREGVQLAAHRSEAVRSRAPGMLKDCIEAHIDDVRLPVPDRELDSLFNVLLWVRKFENQSRVLSIESFELKLGHFVGNDVTRLGWLSILHVGAGDKFDQLHRVGRNLEIGDDFAVVLNLALFGDVSLADGPLGYINIKLVTFAVKSHHLVFGGVNHNLDG